MKQKHYLSLYRAVLASTLFMAHAAFADTTVVNQETNISHVTSVDGNITVTPTGQLLMNTNAVNNGDAILVDAATSAATLINLSSGNTYADPNTPGSGAAILTSGTARYGINIENTATAVASVFVGAGTSIDGIQGGIFVDNNTGSLIQNFGEIHGVNAGAILIGPNGANAIITNGGNITNGTGPSIGPVAAATLMGANTTIFNSGNILSSSPGIDAIQMNNTFGQLNITSSGIHNNAGGIIAVINGAGLGNAINISNAAGAPFISGDIINAGIIRAANTAGAAIAVNANYNGTITNSGIIESTNTGSTINVANSFGVINNTGTIQATNTGSSAINVVTNAAGTINNNLAGVIQSVDVPAILLGGNITAINNNTGGTIQHTGVPGAGVAVIQSTVPMTLIGGLTNSGNITATNVIPVAIDVSNSNVTFTQNGGIVTGNVLLGSKDSTAITNNVFTMNGGIINGNVTAANTAANTLNLAGGIINGNVTGGALGDTFNLSSTDINGTLTGGGNITVNATGGDFNALIGAGAANVLNVLGSFTPSGTIANMQNINVLGAGTVFTENNYITGLNTLLSIGGPGPLGASMVVNGPTVGNAVSGAGNITINNANSSLVINNGRTVNMLPGGIVTNNGNIVSQIDSVLKAASYVQNAGGTFSPQIGAPGEFGQIQVTGAANLAAGSFIAPTIGSTFVPAGTTYNIIQAGPGGITDNATLAEDNSIVVFFSKSGVAGVPCGANQCVQLTSSRIPYSYLYLSEAAQGVAGALDVIAGPPTTTDPLFLKLLGQLDLATSRQQLDEELISLAPVVNGAYAVSSRVNMNTMFNTVQRRLKDLHDLRPLGAEGYHKNPDNMGYSYGDYFDLDFTAEFGPWIEGIGVGIGQKTRDEVEGYTSQASGVAIGFDVGNLETAAVGMALSAMDVHTQGKTYTENVLDVYSYQLTFYGWFGPKPCYSQAPPSWYVDAMLGLVANSYKSRRNINIGTGASQIISTSHASYRGTMLGAQTDIGYAFNYDNFAVAPLVRFKYTHLEADDYTETGSGSLDLTVKNDGLSEWVAGIGFRMAGIREYVEAKYIPEFSAMILYDFAGDRELTTSNFAGPIVAFETLGIKPAKTFYLFSLGIDGISKDNYACTLKYELELRDHFIGNTAYVQFRYQYN